MPFDNLPKQPLMGPVAEAYAADILQRSRDVAASTRVMLDVPYGEDDWQRIDIYLPADEGLRDLPVLLFLHGGGWSHGYKEWMGFMAPCFTDLPAIFVSVGYRLVPQVQFPAPLDDTVAAIAWVRANISRYGGSPDRLFVGGHSAGGHLSALATLRGAQAMVKGCFPVSAVCDFKVGELEARGNLLLARPEDAAEASPLNFVHGNRVPFYIVWGDDDLEYVMRSSPLMVEALKEAGTCVVSEVLPGHDHFLPSTEAGRPGSPWVQTVRAWLSNG